MKSNLGSPDTTTTSETEASSLSGRGAVANRIAEIRAQIEVLAAKAESGEQWAEICRLECEAVKLERGVRTENLAPPIPLRRYDWVAYFDGQEESGPKGFGSTEQQAITELLDFDLVTSRLDAYEARIEREVRELPEEAPVPEEELVRTRYSGARLP